MFRVTGQHRDHFSFFCAGGRGVRKQIVGKEFRVVTGFYGHPHARGLAIARHWATLEEQLPSIREHYERATQLHQYIVDHARLLYADDVEPNSQVDMEELQTQPGSPQSPEALNRVERWESLCDAKRKFYEEDRRLDDLCTCFEVDAEECNQAPVAPHFLLLRVLLGFLLSRTNKKKRVLSEFPYFAKS